VSDPTYRQCATSDTLVPLGLQENARAIGCNKADSVMRNPHPGKDDPRTVDELICAALCDPAYLNDGWEAVVALHWRGAAEVLERAAGLTCSFCAVERRVGADILGQLGIPHAFPTQCVSILRKMLRREADAGVLHSILIALGHLGEPEAIEPASRFRWHHDPEVRYGVVQALTGHEDPLAIESLIELSKDDDARVRDWATFGLGQQLDADTPSLREALIERLTDSDEEARGEALIGLARRGDARLIPALINELESESVGTLAVEAAELIADPQLYSALVALRDCWDVNADLLEAAILACSPRQERA
jgi:hypothetical protein